MCSIEVMYRSLEILKNISGHDERKQTFDELRNTLLEIMRPKVRQDVEESNFEPLHEYLYVYNRLGRYVAVFHPCEMLS